MRMNPPDIILASASPRRAELLESLGLHFRVVPSSAEELHDERLDVTQLCLKNARLKGDEVAARFPAALVIGADTLVALGQKLFGKPRDLDEARRMLAELSDRTHRVVTGVSLRLGERQNAFYDTTEVTFRTVPKETIEEYLRLVHVLDKAGAYGIQERSEMIVERISGSFSNVMGFPTEKFREEIGKWGIIA